MPVLAHTRIAEWSVRSESRIIRKVARFRVVVRKHRSKAVRVLIEGKEESQNIFLLF